MAFRVSEEHAAILEAIDQRAKARQRFGQMLRNVPPKRMHLYKQKIADHAVEKFNDHQLQQRTLKEVYAENSKNNSVADAMVRGDSVS